MNHCWKILQAVSYIHPLDSAFLAIWWLLDTRDHFECECKKSLISSRQTSEQAMHHYLYFRKTSTPALEKLLAQLNCITFYSWHKMHFLLSVCQQKSLYILWQCTCSSSCQCHLNISPLLKSRFTIYIITTTCWLNFLKYIDMCTDKKIKKQSKSGKTKPWILGFA